jgi:nucleoside-diphosphate-sugar epimerase
MRVFVAGATGAIGKQLVPRLVAAGHEVHGMTRSESKQAMLDELGAVPVVADALDPDQVAQAVGEATPDVIVHELTAIGSVDLRHFDRDFALTNRLRTEGTDHLLSAGQAVGVRRFVAQSYGAWFYVRTGGPVKSEEDPLDPTLAREMRETLAAIRHLEEAVLDARWTEGIVLRYGAFYGPGTSLAPGGEQLEIVRKRKFPLIGDGGGVWSFIHIADARRGGSRSRARWQAAVRAGGRLDRSIAPLRAHRRGARRGPRRACPPLPRRARPGDRGRPCRMGWTAVA